MASKFDVIHIPGEGDNKQDSGYSLTIVEDIVGMEFAAKFQSQSIC